MAELERLVSKQALEIEILKKAGSWLVSRRGRKRAMIQQMKADYGVQQVSAMLDGPLSTMYYTLAPADERQLIAAIEAILVQFPFYGYRKSGQGLPIIRQQLKTTLLNLYRCPFNP